MHGLGNDFVVFDGPLALEADAIETVCDRRTGIGADGILIVTPTGDNRVQMGYWNADGSQAEMCGNGLRCVTRYAIDRRWLSPGGGVVDTAVGPLTVGPTGDGRYRVEIGQPVVGEEFGDDLTFRRISVGNPHAVTFVADVGEAPVEQVGSDLEQSTPGGTNVEFAQATPAGIRVRTWERGVGETNACGTGAVATAVAARAAGLSGDVVTILLVGGPLDVELDGPDAFITGPAEYVFSGTTELI